MAIICISRGSATGGRALAHGLAEILGSALVSREDIVRRAAENGVPVEELEHALRDPLSSLEKLGHRRAGYLAFVRLALCERAMEDNIIYHGNAGHLLLDPRVRALRIRMVAPLEHRARALVEAEGISLQEATARIEATDRQRRDWTRFLYGVDPLDPLLYDLVLNLHILGAQGAIEVATAAARRPEFELDDEAREVLADSLLACRVDAALAAHKETAGVSVRVLAQRGVVSLTGRVPSPAQEEAVVRVAESVEGVERLERDGLGSPNLLV